ncbi:MAG: phosphopantetheine-binding protein [Parahaliea sp.]
MSLVNDLIPVIRDVLMIGDRADDFNAATGLLGAIPEFDSVAVVSLVVALEEEFGCTFEDDELNAEVFATVGSLASAVEQKIG